MKQIPSLDAHACLAVDHSSEDLAGSGYILTGTIRLLLESFAGFLVKVDDKGYNIESR